MSFARGRKIMLTMVPMNPKSIERGMMGPEIRRLLMGEISERFWKLNRITGRAMI